MEDTISLRRPAILLAGFTLLISTLACTISPQIPDIDIKVPTIEVGEVQEERQTIPLAGAESADVDVIFGAGRLQLEAGVSDRLLSGTFRYNVDRWAPQITQEGDTLTIHQGGDEDKWGIPSGNVRNRWELDFSPQVPLDVNIRAGAGKGELDFTDLMIPELDVDVGAGDFVLRFDASNPVPMDHLTLDAGLRRSRLLALGTPALRPCGYKEGSATSQSI
jgi:hypothetical protein